MAIEIRTLKRRAVATSATEVQAIPKMVRGASKGVQVSAPRSRRFGSLASLIQKFGEFNLIADPNDIIVGFWASLQSLSWLSSRAILGRPLSSLIQPALAIEVRALAGNTAARHARQEIECPLTVAGVRRWFSVSAIPLRMPGSNRPAICVAARNVTHRVEAMQTLAEREALLAKAEEVANFGSCEIDLKANKVKLSAHLMKLYGLSANQKWSRKIYWDRMHPDDRVRAQRLLDASWEKGQPVEYISRYRAPDGDVRVHLTQSIPVLDQDGKVVRALGVIHDVTENARSHRELRRLSQQLMNEQDTQRRHLARELHESAGQSLASLKMTLGRLREAVAENPGLISDLLNSAAHLTDGAIREIRTVSYLLHPPMLDDAGLGPALRWYVKGFMERSGISATLEISESFPRLSRDIETTAFRVVQEALTNVHRYSGSSKAEIELRHEGSRLHIEIRDQGCGFPPAEDQSQQPTKLGVGISGMRERVEQLDGDFEISSVPGQGTVLRAVLPAVPMKPVPQVSRVNPRARA